MEMVYIISVSFALGILVEGLFHFGRGAPVFTSVLALAVYLSIIRFDLKNKSSDIFSENKIDPKIFLAVGLALSLGILRVSFAAAEPDKELVSRIGQNINFEAVIVDEPDVRDVSIRYTIQPYYLLASVSECSDIFLLKNLSCSPQSGSQAIQKHSPSKSRILFVADRFPEYKYGDRISVSGRLDLPKNFTNQNDIEFDYVSYLSKDRIHFVIYRPVVEKINESEGNKIVSLLYSFKNSYIEKISEVVSEPNSSFLSGIIFGAKQSLGKETLDNFRKVGLVHVVVLSGYNITIIAAGVFWLTKNFTKRNLGFIASAAVVLLFMIMVGLSATIVRAGIMALISILALFLGRPGDALRWLFIAGFLMLLWNPLLLSSDPSFQLSFMATLGLVLFSNIVDESLCSPIFNRARKYFGEWFLNFAHKLKLREIISSTLAVQLFVLPLLINISGEVSVMSFIINPLVLPIIPVAMVFGGLAGALGFLPFVGGILSWPFGALSYVATEIIIQLTELAAALPLSSIQTGSISPLVVMVWYVAYGFLYFKTNRSNNSPHLLLH